MAQKVKAALPPTMDLSASFQIVFTALDPTTGALVSGVDVSNGYMLVQQVSPGTAEQLAQTPLWIPLPLPAPASS
jgi:hypothetical protein